MPTIVEPRERDRYVQLRTHTETSLLTPGQARRLAGSLRDTANVVDGGDRDG